MTGFMAAVAKVGGFAAFLRVFFSSFGRARATGSRSSTAWRCSTLVLGAVVACASGTSSGCWPTRRSTTPGSSCSASPAGTARGVSASLYYLFAYTFMMIGSFAVVTVRRADRRRRPRHLPRYRGLAGRQPVLALAFAVLLLAQAGAPFTTGLWAKLQVVFAADRRRLGARWP